METEQGIFIFVNIIDICDIIFEKSENNNNVLRGIFSPAGLVSLYSLLWFSWMDLCIACDFPAQAMTDLTLTIFCVFFLQISMQRREFPLFLGSLMGSLIWYHSFQSLRGYTNLAKKHIYKVRREHNVYELKGLIFLASKMYFTQFQAWSKDKWISPWYNHQFEKSSDFSLQIPF